MMIKKIIITTTTFSVLLLTGCSQTAPDLTGKNNISDATQIAGDTVTIDENRYGNENGAGGRYNSSSDGFQSIYFEFGDYGVSSGMENSIASNANVAHNASASKIKIEGNCVKDGIAAQGVDTSKMVIVSYGESSPVCSNPTDGCYAQNRRVDLRLVK
jgi:peptidoglycan-associated lipoprotein